MRKRGCAFLCSAVLLTGVFLRMPGEMWQVQAETIDTAAFAEETARLTNQFRQENGLAPLKMAPVLLELSARRAEELKDIRSHPSGRAGLVYHRGGVLAGCQLLCGGKCGSRL